jgi:hypothetical protein
MAIWVNANRVASAPEVIAVYSRAGRGQGTGQGVAGASTPKSAAKGFLTTVKRFVNEGVQALPAWIRKSPGGGPADWQNVQVDITAIPGVRPLRATNLKWRGF